MYENFVDNEPFLCIEVEENRSLDELKKKFDILFPNRTIRLIVNKEYTSYFYVGNEKKWYLKEKIKKLNFSFKVMLEENIFECINADEINIIDSFGINIENLKVLKELIINDEQIDPNCFFVSDGNIHVLKQYNINVDYIYELISKFTDCEIVFNSLNILNNGMLIIKTSNIF